MTNFITDCLPASVTVHHANHAHPDYAGCEDVCDGIFQLDNGRTLTASVDILRLGIASTHGDDWYQIVGTKGVIEAYDGRVIVSLLRPDHLPQEENCRTALSSIYKIVQQLKSDSATGRIGTSLAFKMIEAILQACKSTNTKQQLIINLKNLNF